MNLAVELASVAAEALGGFGGGEGGLELGDLAPAGEGGLVLALEGAEGAAGELDDGGVGVAFALGAGDDEDGAQGGQVDGAGQGGGELGDAGMGAGHAEGVVAVDSVLAAGDEAGLDAEETAEAPMAGGDGLDEHILHGGGGAQLGAEGGEEGVVLLAGLVGREGVGDDVGGEQAVADGVPADLRFALGRAGAGGFLGVGAVGGEGGGGHVFGHGSLLACCVMRVA
ncbi:MAG TPA: hypothetical protein PLJ35_17825 [Anaerolineae bacterium]|nr:hypothetical protein [Anaerolineae bacterium]HOR00675.1 hypothetical protein [Anaerolineae bacterium]